jgi:hypothetical protein
MSLSCQDVFSQLKQCTLSLPDAYRLASVISDSILTLASESESYRPRNHEGNAGSLLDFSDKAKCEELPLIVVPDIHGRYDFLRNVISFVMPSGERIIDLLLSKKVRIVCLGDGMHSESRGRERWILSYLKYVDGIIDSAEMMEEMGENLATMMSVMTLKTLFPENFHFLKGNHENITNRMGDGDYPFCKFAEESTMTHDFMMKEYGGAIVSAFGEFEDNLPLAAVFPHCVLSHAEPSRTFSRDELINARLLDGVVGGLTWTANGDAEEGSVEGTMKNLLKTADAVYIGGHRVVSGKYALRQGGKYIQIHNPHEQNIALVMPNRAFNVDSDIISVL